jgi:hypothetical protein
MERGGTRVPNLDSIDGSFPSKVERYRSCSLVEIRISAVPGRAANSSVRLHHLKVVERVGARQIRAKLRTCNSSSANARLQDVSIVSTFASNAAHHLYLVKC